MSTEERLRSAFAQRAESVEVSPGALFEIQRRIGQRRRVPRVPEVRLRPALVLAAAACAAIAVVISVSVTGPSATPPIQTETPPVAGTADPTALEPTPADPPSTPQSSTSPPEVAQAGPPPSDSGQIITTTPPPTPPTPPAPSTSIAPTPPPDPPPVTDPDPVSETVAAEAPECPAEPEGAGDNLDASSGWVTVYFACGENDAAPRLRSAATNNLPTALGILLSGPNEADSAAGFQGLSGNSATTVTTTTTDRWVTIDLPAGLAGTFEGDGGDITAQQFLTQLNATVFQFTEFDVAEYRLDGNCAAFGALVDNSCRVHVRDGDGYTGYTSELTAHTIGEVDSIIRAEPDDGAAELGFLRDGSRLTEGRSGSGSGAWAEVVTDSGNRGWVSTQTIVAQPLSIDSTTGATMADLARRLTTGPGLESSAFMPAGLVLRWGAGDGDLTVLPTTDAAVGGDWWYVPLGTPSPRDGSPESSPADLLWIDGSGDSATVTINAPGPLGEPHGDFASLAYVSIYRSVIETSTLPPPLGPAPTTTTTTQAPNSEESDLPPALPTPADETDGTADTEERPDPPRAQVSVIFDFLSPDGPRVAAVEAIWIQP